MTFRTKKFFLEQKETKEQFILDDLQILLPFRTQLRNIIWVHPFQNYSGGEFVFTHV